LVIDPLRKETVPLSLPLGFRVPIEQVRRELGFPSSLDLADPIVAKAVALAGAARRWDPPMHFAVFGGTAHRLRCPASNDAGLGLRHELHDMDIAIRLKDSREFRRFLAGVAAREGSGLTFFETSGDRIYNSLSGGQRLRWHMVVEQRGSEVILGTLDLVADAFQFCHRIDIRADVDRSALNGWTLAPAHLLLAKGQFIQRIPRKEASLVSERVLEPFGKRQVVIGPESKDVRDILALLHDHALGEGPGDISTRELTDRLQEAWGLWKTFGLNLAMIARSSILRDLAPEPRKRIEGRLQSVREVVGRLTPKRRFGFLGGPWWQEVDSTPSVDSTASVG
jgi:hypothetical protein